MNLSDEGNLYAVVRESLSKELKSKEQVRGKHRKILEKRILQAEGTASAKDPEVGKSLEHGRRASMFRKQ